ncbi:LysE family translocator [Sapientia aquatica]|uniref:LysE family translocator n=2 Tax=Sapientia aquatica TaxID=1549640 RepID=A0A4R5VQR9_9BURK|nr:LysE family translocator [Sapientia aquatica]
MNIMSSTTLVVFISVIFVLCISPGPNMLLALANGMNSGLRVALFGILGANFGSAILISLVAIGLGSLLTASLELFNILKIVGALYLAWMAYQLWVTKTVPIIVKAQAAQSSRKTFIRAATVSVTNPKGILFLSVFLPQFINTSAPLMPQYLILGSLLIGMDALMMLGYVFLGRRAASLLTSNSLRLLNRICAAIMGVLAIGLASFSRS